MTYKIHTICIHYDATYPDQTIRAADIDKMHKARGFRMIGYNWFIGKDGRLEEGREEGATTAGVHGHNTGVVHICWSGGLDRSTGSNVGHWNINAKQERTLIDLIHAVQKRHPAATKVVGHCNLGPSLCPGRKDVADWWTEARMKLTPAVKPETHGLPKFVPLGDQMDGFWARFKAFFTSRKGA